MPARALPHAPGTSPAAPDDLPTLPAHLAHWAHHTPGRRALTFADHSVPGLSGSLRTLTWHRLDIRTRAVAARLTETVAPGERVALLSPQGTDYVIGLLAALRAGVVAVPLFTPDLPGHADRLAGVLADAWPSAVLTTSGAADTVRAFLEAHGLSPRLIVTDLVPDDQAGAPLPPAPDEQATAYLQYTSGSTRFPTGVEISHANVVANARQALTAYGADTHPVTMVGWLPLYHDMGLVLSVAAPVVRGLLSVLMDPVAFLQRPARWLRLLSDHPNALTAAPNFAYDYCAAVVTDEDKAGLRLDRVAVLANGSEPVRPETTDRFHAAFAGQGLPATVHCPSYGLAEATVFVSAHRPGQPLRRYALDREVLAAGKVLPVAPDDPAAVLFAACGEPVGQSVRIVDPATTILLPEGEVGEIWVQGPNIGRGYAGREPQTRETFHARLGRLPGHWLRTGDLGTMLDGQLLVTGRLKDLIIMDGRNHYPQDVEATAQDAHRAIRPDRLAAFAVHAGRTTGDAAAAGATIAAESAVIVAEHARDLSPQAHDRKEVAAAVRAAVSARHGLRLADVLLVPPGTVPRTSSGKVSRTLTRSRYLDGCYEGFERGTA
ncbi:fatty acyl-AMP ligase [Streptomyces canus]|uniref:fatty acyl-AMP ligase n=1 Tax=Streptomyces canus TaxID=58343 RepID=UPI00386DF5BC|nr:fatty acyl-AMP ligase [Streptomyces canus]